MAVDSGEQDLTIELNPDNELTLDLTRTLERLAALPPSTDAPYLTVSIDWRPEGSRPDVRGGKRAIEQQLDEVLNDHEPHTPAHESLSADLERVRDYLENVPAEAQGVMIVARTAAKVFLAVPLGLPVPTKINVGPTPALAALARVAEDNPTYAVLLADQREASLLFFRQDQADTARDVEGTDTSQQSGGWSQKRVRARAEDHVDVVARSVAEETRRALDEAKVNLLVVATNDAMASALTAEFHQTVTDRIAGQIRLDIEATPSEVHDAARPVVEEAERERERVAVQTVSDYTGAGGMGVGGADDVLTALQTGQVMTLVMNDDFAGEGWADFTFPVYGAGAAPKEHPAGGDVGNIVPIALEEELVRLAILSSAEIEIVTTEVPISTDERADVPDAADAQPRSDAARRLDELGGVGAILRFALDQGQPTADL
ncbi:MAG: hypothetical protein M3R06_08540 [Chloroflexota bacterium]|nr:hypothetical protein [Chloroflexota bacterium]